jgi:hypothetical protein
MLLRIADLKVRATCIQKRRVRSAGLQARDRRSSFLVHNSCVPIGSAFHERTLELCESLNYRDWAGYYAVSAYETHHEHEYNANRNACA